MESNSTIDIEKKKEYVQFKFEENDKNVDTLETNTSIIIDKEIEKEGILLLNGYQQFINNFMSYNEENNRMLLMHSTGVGKTITSLSTSINQMNNIGGNVFILGFSKSVFKRELMNRPEFGFVTKEEVEYVKNLKDEILKYRRQQDIDKLKEIKRKIMLRISKNKESRILFIGYKMLANKIFVKLSSKANLDSIKSKEDIDFMLEKKWIKVNEDFAYKLKYSFIICDEVHNLYNSKTMNSWGLCVKYIIDSIPSKVLFLSATPVNNRPEKIVSVINLLSEGNNYKTSDIFFQKDISEKGMQIIKKEIKGKISFLVSKDYEKYPTSNFIGEQIQGIKYLRIVECKASKLQEDTIMNLYNNTSIQEVATEAEEEKDTEENMGVKVLEDEMESEEDDLKQISKMTNRIPLEGKYRSLNDMVYPSENSNLGIFYKDDILREYSNMSVEFSKNKEIVFRNNRNVECVRDVDGAFLNESNIKEYSSKYYKMLQIIKDIFSNDKGKLFIYHNYVQGTGTCIIKNILVQNGIIEHGDTSSAKTRCSKCYNYKIDHNLKNKSNCLFKSLTFIYATGSVSKSELEYKLELFNSRSNSDGHNIGIILGSQAIKESYDFKAVRNIVVAYMPDNISTLIQILGRAVRKNSHINLDREKRNVDIYILITTLSNEDSFEKSKYIYKTKIFEKIKQINKILMENAVDRNNNNFINHPTGEKEEETIYSITNTDGFHPTNISSEDIDRDNFKAYYYNEEVGLCQYMIKRIMADYYPTPVLFEDIQNAILYRNKRSFDVNRNTELIELNSIITALYYLTTNAEGIDINNNDNKVINVIDNLFKPNKFVDVDGKKLIIKHVDNIFILAEDVYYNKYRYYDFYRPVKEIKDHKLKGININNIVNNSKNIAISRDIYIESILDVNIENMDYVIQKIEPNIHLNTIEYIIEYFNNMWLSPEKWVIHKYHDILIKLLFFYNKFNIIIFANYIDVDTEKEYKQFYTKKFIKKSKLKLTTSSDSHYKEYQNLENTINASEEHYEYIKKGLKYSMYYKYKEKFYPIKKDVKDFLIPIGHYFNPKIKIFSKNKWSEPNHFNKLGELGKRFKNNKYIIGFLEKDKSGFQISFKIRLDNEHNTNKNIDQRKIITGSVCEHFEKKQLTEICKKLGIQLENKEDERKYNMCHSIKIKLIEMELEARKNESNVRYFKFYWE
jgi:superfamily II DNA or RNA helicase/ribosomal protein S8